MKSIFLQTVALLALFCVTTNVAFSQDDEKALEKDVATTTKFTEIKGKVVDSRGKPIEKFSVKLQVRDYTEGGWRVPPKIVKNWEGEFEDGEFQFDVTKPFPINKMTYVTRTVTAPGCLDLNQQGAFTLLSNFKGDFGKIKLSRGIKIKGKVVMPDSLEDEELNSPRVFIMKKMGMMPNFNNMFQRSCKVQKDGTFETTVPENCKLLLTASSNNAATTHQQFTIRKSNSTHDEQDLGDIKLSEGVSVTGTVLTLDGLPAKGQIVEIRQQGSNSAYMQDVVLGHALTDDNGDFSLPPRDGECKISLVENAKIESKTVKVKGDLLKAAPVSVTLKMGLSTDIEIRESRTWKIHGIVNLENGKPSMQSSLANGAQISVELDDDGRFEIEAIDGTKPYLILYHSVGTELYMARMNNESLQKFREHFTGSPGDNGQSFRLKKVTSDIGPLMFDMVKHVPEEKTVTEVLFDWLVNRK